MDTLVKTIDGFEICFEAIEETECLDASLDPETIEGINNGTYTLFCAKVSVIKAGLELASEYLGQCVYADPNDFYKETGGYFDAMAAEALDAAKKRIVALNSIPVL